MKRLTRISLDNLAAPPAAPPIDGTAEADTLTGTADRDTIRGFAGDDHIFGNGGNDLINSGPGSDTVHGGAGANSINLSFANPDGPTTHSLAYGEDGNDRISANDGDDTLYGGNGNDTLDGDLGNDSVVGGAGNDQISGGAFSDTLDGGLGIDTLHWEFNAAKINLGVKNYHVATVNGTTIIRNFENVETATGNDSVTGSAAANRIETGDGNDIVSGLDGNDIIDTLWGVDTVFGGKGNDVIGSTFSQNILTDGGDEVSGGLGADRFIFRAAWQSPVDTPDTITDFQHGIDHIDLRLFIGAFGATTLDYIGSAGFTAPNQVRFENGVLQVNSNSSPGADFAVLLTGVTVFTESDLLLS